MNDRLEHPAIVRVCHWAFALALAVLIGSGLEVFAAFPAFGEKIPQSELFVPPSLVRIGGWLGGALQWHFTFAWLLAAAMLAYSAYQVVSRNGRQVWFAAGDVRGVWPMVRHYFLFGPKPIGTETYNPLQKLAYTIALLLIVVSLITGFFIPGHLVMVALHGWKNFAGMWTGGGRGNFHEARLRSSL